MNFNSRGSHDLFWPLWAPSMYMMCYMQEKPIFEHISQWGGPLSFKSLDTVHRELPGQPVVWKWRWIIYLLRTDHLLFLGGLILSVLDSVPGAGLRPLLSEWTWWRPTPEEGYLAETPQMCKEAADPQATGGHGVCGWSSLQPTLSLQACRFC